MASSRHHRHRRQAGSHRDSAVLESYAVPVGAGVPANTGEAGAIHRGACFAGMPAPTRIGAALRTVQYLYERAQGSRTVDPTVRRADSSACALAASLNGYRCWISTTSLPLPIIANRSSAIA